MAFVGNNFHQPLPVIDYCISTGFWWYDVPLLRATHLHLIQGFGSLCMDPQLTPWAQPTDSRWGWDLGTGWATPAGWCCGSQITPWWLWLCVWGHCPAGRQSPSTNEAATLTGGGSPWGPPYTVWHSWSPCFGWDGLGPRQRSTPAAWCCHHHAWLGIVLWGLKASPAWHQTVLVVWSCPTRWPSSSHPQSHPDGSWWTSGTARGVSWLSGGPSWGAIL